MRKIYKKNLLLIIGIVVLLCMYSIESKPYQIHHSSIFSSPNLTETRLYVVVNSLLPIDREELTREIVENHVRLNGTRPNLNFELVLYRTEFHYRMHWINDTIFCDEYGEIR